MAAFFLFIIPLVYHLAALEHTCLLASFGESAVGFGRCVDFATTLMHIYIIWKGEGKRNESMKIILDC